MKKNGLEELFKRLQSDLDLQEPAAGHHERFLEKLNHSKDFVQLAPKKTPLWQPLSIAASIVIICVLGVQLYKGQDSIQDQIVEIAPEVSKTEFYFASLIEEQVDSLTLSIHDLRLICHSKIVRSDSLKMAIYKNQFLRYKQKLKSLQERIQRHLIQFERQNHLYEKVCL